MLYFVEAVGLNHIKIGVTADRESLCPKSGMTSRLLKLQTGNSYPLRVLGTMPGDKRDEAVLHARFKNVRGMHIRGEWFKAEARLLDYIRAETRQFANLEAMDRILGKKLTGDNRPFLPTNDNLVRWDKFFADVSRRLADNEPADQIAASFSLPRLGSCTSLGHIIARPYTFDRACIFLFIQDGALYQTILRAVRHRTIPPKHVVKTIGRRYPTEVYWGCCEVLAYLLAKLPSDERLYFT